jgi:hypothetical protein
MRKTSGLRNRLLLRTREWEDGRESQLLSGCPAKVDMGRREDEISKMDGTLGSKTESQRQFASEPDELAMFNRDIPANELLFPSMNHVKMDSASTLVPLFPPPRSASFYTAPYQTETSGKFCHSLRYIILYDTIRDLSFFCVNRGIDIAYN